MLSLRCLKRLSGGRITLIIASKFGTGVATTSQETSAGAVAAVGVLRGRFQSLDGTQSNRCFGPFGVQCSFLKPVTSQYRNGESTQRCLHTSTSLLISKWEGNNRKVYPPQKPGEPPRMAEVYYSRRQIKHSMRKMWYIATFVKGMMIDDALTQLQFINRKGAKIVREVLLEAQEEAVKNHNVEFKTNLHIAESFVGKGEYDHAMRIHAKGRFSILDLVHCHYFVCLREGPTPKRVAATGYDQAQHYMDSLRKRTVTHSI